MTAVGERVIAIRNGEGQTINSYGTGTYVGKEVPTARQRPITDDERQQYESYLRADDEAADRNCEAFVEHWAERNAVTEDQVTEKRAEIQAHDAAEAAKPMGQRVDEMHARVMGNPKIVLDTGDVIWGYRCWWGAEAQVLDQYKGFEFVEVPAPEGNEHVDGWIPPAI